ncbi:TonB-dependent receptor [Fibrisoma montanum]|uniref:TonB-dependent receptor n=1 Tax=Fibrisoma montanum TaxID=2305895 RepID=A0A418LWC9_9BACT|nr:TonB-dependent receptor [Fibrisoma montanum]RIV17585.1 TonB-dependent receptor [Fibrisoma montanum]
MKKIAILLNVWLWVGLPLVMAQQRVTGTVTSAPDNSPLPGVSISITGTTRGTTTDVNGNYSLQASDGEVLRFSAIGFTSVDRPVQGPTLNVTLQEDARSLNEVVVVGYGTQRKADVTGAISSVKAQDIANRPVLSAEQALQGKAAGVLITTGQGAPGAAPSVRIRGVGTTGNSNPLYVVDGMFVDDIRYLAPNDIASIDVLKDASSLAIYGVRGANGVVLITTKTGKPGKATVTYDGYGGFTQVTNRIRLANATQFATLVNEALAYEDPNATPRFPNPQSLGGGTNWFDQVLQRGAIQNHQVTVAGGSDKSTFNVSGGYFRQEGVVKGSAYERFSLRVNNTYQVLPVLRLGNNIALTHYTSDNVPNGVVQTAYGADPTVTPINADGTYGFSNVNLVANPTAQLAYNDDRSQGERLVGNIFGEVTFLKDFTFRSSFGVDVGYNRGRVFLPRYRVSASQFRERSQLTRTNDLTNTWLWENTLTYTKTFNKIHNVTVLAGATAQQSRFDILTGSALDVPGYNEDVKYINLGNEIGRTANDRVGGQVPYVFSYASYLGRVNYSLLDKYLLTVSVRRDGSSRFPPSNRYATFPAVGLGWRISEEPFLRGKIDNLKLRVSYGKLGNTNIPNYLYYARVTPNLNAVFGPDQNLYPGATELNPVTSSLTWEVVTQTDIGLEWGFFNNRLSIETDYYNRKTNDVVLTADIGNGQSIQTNAGSVQNRGFELSANWRDQAGDFNYEIGANLTTLDNKLTSLGNGGIPIIGGGLGNGRTVTLTNVGQPIGAFYGYEVAGIFQSEADIANSPTQANVRPGDLRFRDQNNDGRIDGNDRVYLGTPLPKAFWGFNSRLSYKSFDLILDLQGSHGNSIYNGKKAVRFGNENFEASVIDRWTATNPSTTEPRVSTGGNNFEVSDYFLESGSFVRIRTAQLGYNLPAKLINKAKIQRARVYLNALNPLTFTKYTGFSPEVGSNDANQADLSRGVDVSLIPVYATYTAGLNVTF